MALIVGAAMRPLVAEVAAPETSVGANTGVTRTVTVPGLTTDMCVVVNWPGFSPLLAQGGAWVSATNTLSINITNPTAGGLVPSSGKLLKVVAL